MNATNTTLQDDETRQEQLDRILTTTPAKQQHTLGPWSIAGYSGETCDTTHIYAPAEGNTRCIAKLNPPSKGSLFVNARLMAAAPDLAEALKAAHMALLGYTHRNQIISDAIAACNEALHKAGVYGIGGQGK